MQRTFRYNSGRVVCELRGGLAEVAYSGPLTADAYDALRADGLQATKDADAFVVRLDRTVIAMADAPARPETYAANSAAGAWIVRPDQYEFWVRHAQQVAKYGIMRAVWLESHSRLAYEWALRQAAVRRSRLQQ